MEKKNCLHWVASTTFKSAVKINVHHRNLSKWLLGFHGGSAVKKRHKRWEFNPQVGKIPWRRAWQPFHYSCLENPMNRGAWWARVYRVTKSWTWQGTEQQQPNDFKKSNMLFFFFFFYLLLFLCKAMAPHSSTLAWKIPWTEEPRGLPSTGSYRVGHDWSDLAAAGVVLSFYFVLGYGQLTMLW